MKRGRESLLPAFLLKMMGMRRRKRRRKKTKKRKRMKVRTKSRNVLRVKMSLRLWKIWIVNLGLRRGLMTLMPRRRMRMTMDLPVSCGITLDSVEVE
jgi:hypothetical protein